MYVLITQPYTPPCGVAMAAGTVLEVPHEYYNPQTMTRLGTALTPAQRSQLVSCGWLQTPNGE